MHPYDNFKLSGAGGVSGPTGGLGIPGSAADERYEDRNYHYPLSDKQRQSFHEPVDDKEVRVKMSSWSRLVKYIIFRFMILEDQSY